MNTYQFLRKKIILVMAILILLLEGCKYDVAEPLWEKDSENPPTPQITQVDPSSSAAPGINYITIHGENFINVPDQGGVLFDDFSAEIVEKSETMIKVRRPNIVSDSCVLIVVPGGTYTVAKDVYKVDRVSEPYGSFLDNLQLAIVTVDNNENLYVVESTSKKIHKVAPNGDKTNLGLANRAPTEAMFGPDNNLYLLGNDRRIDKIDIATGEVTVWTQLPQGRIAKFGDFDGNYLYAGQNSGLFIIPFDTPGSATLSGFYTGEEILSIRAYNGYLYVVSRIGASPARIWKHQLQSGTLGTQELVIDLGTADSTISSRLVKSIAFSSDGTIFIATDNTNPLLTYNPAAAKLDIFYKEILPPYCKHFYWGNENYLYMISGNNAPAQEWNVFRVNIGTTGEQ